MLLLSFGALDHGTIGRGREGWQMPLGPAVQRTGVVIAIPILCGLHHHYVRFFGKKQVPRLEQIAGEYSERVQDGNHHIGAAIISALQPPKTSRPRRRVKFTDAQSYTS